VDQSTRVRPVVQVDAEREQTRPQPLVAPTPAVAHVAMPAADAAEPGAGAETRRAHLRGSVVLTADHATRRRLPRGVTGIAAGLVVAGALVAIGIAVNGAAHAPTRPLGSGDPSTTIVVDDVPSPTGLTGSRAADGSVTFTWTNPSPEPDDHYLWGLRTATTEPVLALVSAPTVTVPVAAQRGPTPSTPAAEVCIEVSIVRADGRASATPVLGCVR